MPTPVAIVAGIVLAVVIMLLVVRSRRSNDGVDSFRRQIDALSPEARRPVIDQMYGTADRPELRIEPHIEPHPSAAPERAGGDDSDGDDGDDEDGDGDDEDGDGEQHGSGRDGDGEQHDESDVHGA
jgi:hypothetical protein